MSLPPSTSTMEEDKRRISIGIDEATYISAICKQFDLEIRQIEKAIDLLSVICSTWSEPVPVETTLIFPMIVGFLKGNPLNSKEEIDEIFLIQRRDNSVRNLAVDDKNINELYRLMSQYSRKTLSEAHNEKVALHNNAQWNALSFVSQIGYEILEAEYDYTHDKNQRSFFASYANRIKMAGRFIQSDIVP